MGVQHTSAVTATSEWWKRENLIAGMVLLLITLLAWGYTLQIGSMRGMPMHGAAAVATGTRDSAGLAGGMHAGMEMPGAAVSAEIQPARTPSHAIDVLLFTFGLAVMMVAMMLPGALPLILLYRMTARKQYSPWKASAGMGALLAGYVAVWTAAGLPVYGYGLLAASWGPAMAVLPAMLLVAGGIYQFTALKQSCHTRCSNPLFFLAHRWRPGMPGAARLGVLHGIDCLGCCVGLMLALIGLGMMNVAWMLTAAVIIFVEKTLPGGHRVARPLGVTLVLGGLLVLGVYQLARPTAMA
jgi:predicted metal-binding membrane protein